MTVGLLQNEKQFIGNGRSAKVYYSYNGKEGIATKTFTGEPVSKLILFVLTGSANPYTWCEDAIKSAIIRRRILSHLCRFWFGKQLRLPNTYGYRWNPEHKAFEIDAEFITGCHAPLLNPMKDDPFDYMGELRRDIMNPLQAKLIDSGFDGLVWQAGKGNPVGASNFMMKKRKDGTHQWIWIDLESGLPALFAMNPLSTLGYYLPKCVKHRDWLFDNVDTEKLQAFLKKNKTALLKESSPESYQKLMDDCAELAITQSNWKSEKRYLKSLYYSASQDKITPEEKEYFIGKPLQWYLKSLTLFISSFISSFGEKVQKVINKIRDFKYKKTLVRAYKYFADGRYRWGLARWFLKREIDKWHNRKSLTDEERSSLLRELSQDDISAYLTDFSIHLGLKPFVKIFAYLIVPVLMAMGWISIPLGAILVLWTGPFARTVYTLLRFTNSLVQNRKHYPFIALVIGAFPIIGNLAYPIEFFYHSTGNRNLLAKYIAYAFSAKIGAKIPIWGGKDSEIEHFFNRVCHRVLSF